MIELVSIVLPVICVPAVLFLLDTVDIYMVDLV